MKAKWSPVSENYFGNTIGNLQDCDELGDQSSTPEMQKITGRGARGGGSKPSRNPGRSGSATLGSSKPRSAQKIRG